MKGIIISILTCISIASAHNLYSASCPAIGTPVGRQSVTLRIGDKPYTIPELSPNTKLYTWKATNNYKADVIQVNISPTRNGTAISILAKKVGTTDLDLSYVDQAGRIAQGCKFYISVQ